MSHVDSNVLTGLAVPVDYHHNAAVALVEQVISTGGGPLNVSEAVVLETLQVLRRRHGVGLKDAADGVLSLLLHEAFEVDSDVIEALTLVSRRPALGFVDALLLARARSTGAPVLTFDRSLERALARDAPAS